MKVVVVLITLLMTESIRDQVLESIWKQIWTFMRTGRVPFGVKCPMPPKEEEKSYIEETISSLRKKNLLDDNQKLTKEGAEVFYLWEQYRNCKKHIRLNHVNAAVLPGNTLITVIETEEGYEVGCIRRDLFMLELLKHHDYLCMGEEKAERGKWQNIEEKEWKELLSEIDGCILLYEYECGRMLSEKVYFWKGEQGYLFHKTRGRIRTLSPVIMKKQIYRILGEEANGE